jgi:hypothetical protein
MFKTKTFTLILKILIQNRVLMVNFNYKTYREKSSTLYPLPSQRPIRTTYKVAKKKRLSFLDSLFSSVMLTDALNGWQSIIKC